MFLEHLNANMAREFCRKLPKIELHAHLNGSLSVSTITKLHKLHKLSFPNEEVPNVSDITIGQAQDMFSRIYRIRIYKYFSTKDYVIHISFDFLKCLKLRGKNKTFLTNKEFVFSFN